MINKIVFINYEKITKKVRSNYLIDYLISQNFVVEYWDVTLLIIDESHITDLNFVTIIHSYRELDEKIHFANKNEVLFIPLFNLDGNAIKLYRHFTISKVKLAFFCWGQFPALNRSLSNKLLSKKFNFISIKKSILNQISKLYKKFGYIKEYDYVFASGSIASERFVNSNIKQVNFFDYDTYYSIKDNYLKIIDSDYCVFLDVNATFHNDLKLLGVKTIDPDSYFIELNMFFDKIEKQYGVNVIIAAHPTSNYDPEIFKGRKILKYKTAELVRDSKFVLSSVSTSISYALLFNKPIIFHYTQDIKINYKILGYTDMCEYLAAFFGCSVYNISLNYELDNILKIIDAKIRDIFIKDYYTSDQSQNSSTKLLLIKYLKEI